MCRLIDRFLPAVVMRNKRLDVDRAQKALSYGSSDAPSSPIILRSTGLGSGTIGGRASPGPPETWIEPQVRI